MRSALKLALAADICLNSARKAIKLGSRSLKGRAGERAREQMAALGIADPSDPQAPASRAA